MTRQRLSALIIENKRILLSRDFDADHFNTPGGALDEGETFEKALERELKEELKVTIENSRFYCSHKYFNTKLNVEEIVHNYIVNIKELPQPSGEISEIRFFSKEEIESNKFNIFHIFLQNVYHKLIKDSLI